MKRFISSIDEDARFVLFASDCSICLLGSVFSSSFVLFRWFRWCHWTGFFLCPFARLNAKTSVSEYYFSINKIIVACGPAETRRKNSMAMIDIAWGLSLVEITETDEFIKITFSESTVRLRNNSRLPFNFAIIFSIKWSFYKDEDVPRTTLFLMSCEFIAVYRRVSTQKWACNGLIFRSQSSILINARPTLWS